MRIQYLGSDSNNLQIRNVSLWIFWPFEKILFGGWVIQIQRQLIKCVFRYGFPNCCINCIHISLIFGGFLYKFLIKSEKFLVFYLTLGDSFSTTTGSISKNLGIPSIYIRRAFDWAKVGEAKKRTRVRRPLIRRRSVIHSGKNTLKVPNIMFVVGNEKVFRSDHYGFCPPPIPPPDIAIWGK